MTPLTKKVNVLFASLLLSLTIARTAHAATLANQNNFTKKLTFIKDRTVATTVKPKPEDLDRQLKDVMTEITTAPHIDEQVINQLLEIAVDTSRQDKDSAVLLRGELELLLDINNPNIAALPYDVKEQIVHAFSYEARSVIFERIGEQIFESRHPFVIPPQSRNLSQLDMFLLISMILTVDEEGKRFADESKSDWILLNNAFLSCLGLKDVTKLKTRLYKQEIITLIPESLKVRIFSRNPVNIIGMANHIGALTSTYH